MTSRLKNVQRFWWAEAFAFCHRFLLAYLPGAFAQSVVVMVNDDPVASYDVAQRQRFLAVTSGLGDKMRARLQSEDTKKAFQAYMTKHQPQSRDEAQELQKKFVAEIEKDVVASVGNSVHQEAIDQLIDERLMLQAAKEQRSPSPTTK